MHSPVVDSLPWKRRHGKGTKGQRLIQSVPYMHVENTRKKKSPCGVGGFGVGAGNNRRGSIGKAKKQAQGNPNPKKRAPHFIWPGCSKSPVVLVPGFPEMTRVSCLPPFGHGRLGRSRRRLTISTRFGLNFCRRGGFQLTYSDGQSMIMTTPACALTGCAGGPSE